MTRLTDDDRNFGPLTIGNCGKSWRPLRLVLESGDDEEGAHRNAIVAYAFGWVARLWLPNIIRPYRIKHIAHTWDDATVARMGRNWYYETHSRKYGFSLSDGFFQVFLGAQTHDSTTTKNWCCHLPWIQWRFVRMSYYGLAGETVWTEYGRNRARGMSQFNEQHAAKEEAPKCVFELLDYDNEIIQATTVIEEREWHFGTGWFKWLSWFRPAKIGRSLDIAFSAEVGPKKGSWKGGTLGHGIDMLPGELHEAAFRRYCDQAHRLKFVRQLEHV